MGWQILRTDDSARVLGMVRLVGQVEEMVAESGDPTGFNAAPWLARWLDSPLPALAGQRPAEFMDTADGQAIVSSLDGTHACGHLRMSVTVWRVATGSQSLGQGLKKCVFTTWLRDTRTHTRTHTFSKHWCIAHRHVRA